MANAKQGNKAPKAGEKNVTVEKGEKIPPTPKKQQTNDPKKK